MDFQRLPKNIFLDILGYLNVVDRVRAQRINRLWSQMCILALRERPISFDNFFFDFKSIPLYKLRRLLRLCHHRIVKIRFDYVDDESYEDFHIDPEVLLSAMAEFNYPKLNHLYISAVWKNWYHSFFPLFRNAPNLKILHADGDFDDCFLQQLPGNCFSMLEHIQLSTWINTRFISSTFYVLGDQYKNLKSLLGYWDFATDYGSEFRKTEIEDLNYFFGECSQLRRLSYNDSDIFALIPNFWKLQFLEKIDIDNCSAVDDTFLHSLSVSFPLLKELEIRLGKNVTPSSVACLDNMKNLQKLVLMPYPNMPLLVSDEFVAVVDNLGTLRHVTVRHHCMRADSFREVATKFVNNKAVVSVDIHDYVKNIIPELEYLANAGIHFKYRDHPCVPASGAIPTLITNLKSLPSESWIRLGWDSI